MERASASRSAGLAIVALLCAAGLGGCSGEEPPSPDLGKKLLPIDLLDADEGTREHEGLAAILGLTREELRNHVDPEIPPSHAVLRFDDAFGRVVRLRGVLKQFWPRRDGTPLPGDLKEVWTGLVFDLKDMNQPYRVVFPGTPDQETRYEGERVEVNGLVVGVMAYTDQGGRDHRAPVLVSHDIRKLVVK